MRLITRPDIDYLNTPAYPAIADRVWAYYTVVLDWLKGMPEGTRVLEVGPGYVPLCADSDVLDVEDLCKRTTYLWDASRTPWPVADKAYDVVVASEVLEHLTEGAQPAVFQELKRVARNAFVTLPYMWGKGPHVGHDGIDLKRVLEWSGGEEPVEMRIVDKDDTPHWKHIACRWRFA